MKSGLEDRNNPRIQRSRLHWNARVSMKSGLEDRNNFFISISFLSL